MVPSVGDVHSYRDDEIAWDIAAEVSAMQVVRLLAVGDQVKLTDCEKGHHASVRDRQHVMKGMVNRSRRLSAYAAVRPVQDRIAVLTRLR